MTCSDPSSLGFASAWSTPSGKSIGKYIGMGSPQYLWRENTQSRSLYVIFGPPEFSSSSLSVIALLASVVVMPSKSPLLTLTPCSVNAASIGMPSSSLTWSPPPTAAGATTRFTPNPNFVANSKSRSSCAGTAITAPVP